jgi:hypothetical protein
MAESRRWRGLLRFNLAALMFVTLCVCGYLGSYRYGERAGAKQYYDESFFTKMYPLADLLIDTRSDAKRTEQAAAIIKQLQATVSPASWTAPDMQHGEIQWYPQTGALIVSQHGAVHDQLAPALENLRKDASRKLVEAAFKDIEPLGANTRHKPIVLVSFSSPDNLKHQAIEQRFESIVQGVEQHWGRPRFGGECTEVGFPAWAVAQKIAVWSSNDGEAYIALQEQPELGRVVLAGWREAD